MDDFMIAGMFAILASQHWILLATVTIALVIDVMKPATLGFVVPGMRTGLVAASTKLGGILGAGLGASSLVTGSSAWAVIAVAPIAAAVVILVLNTVETRGTRLDEIKIDNNSVDNEPIR